jgi:hypothetical protein
MHHRGTAVQANSHGLVETHLPHKLPNVNLVIPIQVLVENYHCTTNMPRIAQSTLSQQEP